jgi:ACR3 family arsenite efflux pump ArsB
MLPISPKSTIMKELLWWMLVRAILVFLIIPMVVAWLIFSTMWDMMVIAWFGYREVKNKFDFNDKEREKRK